MSTSRNSARARV